jgi:hypothetical protein
MNLQEFHAYQNPDGTYRIEANSTVKYGEVECGGKLIITRTKLTIEPLTDYDTCTVITFIPEDNNNDK